jgi:hypothetical protein
VTITGFFEILGAIGLLLPARARVAAVCLALLLMVTFCKVSSLPRSMWRFLVTALGLVSRREVCGVNRKNTGTIGGSRFVGRSGREVPATRTL